MLFIWQQLCNGFSDRPTIYITTKQDTEFLRQNRAVC